MNPELADLAKRLGCGLVATNDVHFLNKEDHFAHDVLCCISMGRLMTDENRLKYPTELYLKSPDEMNDALGNFDGAMENTARIAEMCNLDLDFSKKYAPVYRSPEGEAGQASCRHGHASPRNDGQTDDDDTYSANSATTAWSGVTARLKFRRKSASGWNTSCRSSSRKTSARTS